MRNLLILCIIFIGIQETFATHLIGGSIGYEYVGQFGSNYRFKIILTTYTNCDASSNIQSPEDPIQDVGIYTHDIQNDPTGGGNKAFLTSVPVNLILDQSVDPPIPGNCAVGQGTCIRKGVYEGFVDLPLNFTGYHVYYERCCRNNSITNLIPQESMAFYCFMSPPLLGNSSPVFTDDPVPFLCVGDTTSILNSAFDPDGDLLTFSFVTPYNGYASAANPAPAAPTPTLGWTVPNVTYAAGYSQASPFGAGGGTFVNASTGLTRYFPVGTGDYVVAIEVKEFRNGNLIGITRRDLQLLVLNCPNNPGPNIDPSAGTTSTSFTIEEGESLCIDYGYTDPNNDSVYVNTSGAIFDPSIINPAATVTSPVGGVGAASTQFCWTTACGQAQTAPYQFQVSATDNGCPPKTTNDVYQITVNPVDPPSVINGNQVACQFSTETYSTNSLPNTTYNWSVTGGTIVADNGSSVDINWTAVGAASVSVTATNQFGCSSVPLDYTVTLTPAPTVDAGVDVTLCAGDTVGLVGTTNSAPGFTSTWTPGTDIINGNTLSPDVFPSDTIQYFLTVDLGGCSNLDSVTVFVVQPTVNAGNDTLICAGDSVQLQGQTTEPNFSWSPIANLSDPNILNPFASPTTSTSYILEVTDGSGCVSTDTVLVTVTPSFTLTVSNDTTVCDGDCANLSASGAASYTWTPSATLSDGTIANPQACPPATTTYTVIGLNGVCSDTANVTVSVGVTPNIDAGTDTDICLGDTTTLNASGGVSYVWSPTNDLSNPSISNPDAFPSATTQYFVTGSDALGCTDIDSVTVTVNALPTADAGLDKNICVSASNGGSSPTETLDGSGSGTPLWTPSTGLSDPSIFTPIINPAITTTYVLEVTDGNGCENTDTVTVTVFDEVPTEAGDPATICPGDTITIGGYPSGEGAVTTYSWSPAGLLDDATVPNPQAFPTTTTMFYLSTSNDTCSGLDSVLITVFTPPSINAGLDTSICIGDSAALNVTGGTAYTWNTQSTLTDSTIANPLAFPSVTTQYVVEGEDANGCTNTDTVVVSVNPLPIIDAGINDTICLGDTTQLIASGGNSYSWLPNDSISNPSMFNPEVFPSLTGYYYVTGTDLNQCSNIDSVLITVNSLPLVVANSDTTICFGDSAQLSATGAINYSWSPSADLNNSNIANPLAGVGITTTFVVTGSDLAGCFGTDTTLVTVNNLPTVEAGPDVQICINDTTTLNASGAQNYQWTPSAGLNNTTISNPTASPSDTTLYFVTGIDALGCSNMDSVQVIVNPLPTIDAGMDVDICRGNSTVLNASGGDTYMWSPMSSLDNAAIASPTATPDSTQLYVVIGTDTNACVFSDSVTVNVFRISTIPDETICVGDSVQLEVFGSNGNSYTWSPSTGLSNPNISNPIAEPNVTTTYYVSVNNVAGCQDQDSVTISILSAPIADVGFEIDAGCDSAVVYFQNNSIGGVSYLWNFGDGTTDTIENPSHSYPYGSNFQATLEVVNINGCNSITTIAGSTLTFEDYYSIYIPNVFTPNGDGENDLFYVNIPGELYKCADFRVYNRWGQIIFISNGNNIKWDGRTSVGQEVPNGTYMYIIDVNGKQYHGTVTLFK